MNRNLQDPRNLASERATIRRRVKQMYQWLNQRLWGKCYSLIDPKLQEKSSVDRAAYEQSLSAFLQCYGEVRPWFIRTNLHLDARRNKHDDRPFAYVYVVWQDQKHGFHMFRERWVKHSGQWYTRVVGLVPNSRNAADTPD